jgi:rSAM-associated Gly-rich repeat protein
MTMANSRRTAHELLKLLPSGVAGLSISLASADALAIAASEPAARADRSITDRLQSIRNDVAGALEQYAEDGKPFVAIDPQSLLAWFGNGGWHNGGFGNGGWHNGGFGNGGWHNGGFGNGGWHNGFRNW